MIKLLSKESTLFSVPLYMGGLLLLVLWGGSFSLTPINVISHFLAFLGMAINYVLFNRIALNRQTHLPLFLYTIFSFTFYDKSLDIGISVAILVNAILLFFLTDDHPKFRENSYAMIGSTLAMGFIFLPTAWMISLFILLHIIATSDRIIANILKLIFGLGWVFLGYFCLMFSLGFTDFDEQYLPLISNQLRNTFSQLYALIPIVLMVIFAIADHFLHFNKKSPASKFKYSFVLGFLLVQGLTLIFYMGDDYQYLLLISLPLSIILSRFLRFLPQYWMKELGFWTILISCGVFFYLKF